MANDGVTPLPKAKWVMVHDDGKCLNGQELTPLNSSGYCPVCNRAPDMQSTAFIFHCPVDEVRLGKDKKCPVCKNSFDTSR